jgi:hypothetical protein
MNLFTLSLLATAALAVLKLAGFAAIGWWTVFLPVIFTGIAFLLLLILTGMWAIWMWNK